jgi:hypothetical protein
MVESTRSRDRLPFFGGARSEPEREPAMKKSLQKLNKEEVDRLRKFYEYGPMVKRPIDEELARKGWLQPNDIVDGEVRAYEASDAAYRKGIPILFDEGGAVKDHWLLEELT